MSNTSSKWHYKLDMKKSWRKKKADNERISLSLSHWNFSLENNMSWLLLLGCTFPYWYAATLKRTWGIWSPDFYFTSMYLKNYADKRREILSCRSVKSLCWFTLWSWTLIPPLKPSLFQPVRKWLIPHLEDFFNWVNKFLSSETDVTLWLSHHTTESLSHTALTWQCATICTCFA